MKTRCSFAKKNILTKVVMFPIFGALLTILLPKNSRSMTKKEYPTSTKEPQQSPFDNAKENRNLQPESNSGAETTPPDPHKVWVEGLHRAFDKRLILVVLMISLTMALLQVSTVNVTLATLTQSLGASTAQVQWVLSGYALAIGIVLVPAGRMGDIFGRRLMFIIGLAAFAVTSALCGLVTDPTMLNLMRILQGISAGIFSPQTTGIIQQFFDGVARAKAYALMGLVVSATVAAGPILAGAMIAWLGGDLGWRSTFILNLPIGVVGVIAAMRWLPIRGHRTPTQREQAKSRIDLDPLGMMLLALAVVAMMLPFILKGAFFSWFLLPISVLLLVLWVWWEAYYKSRGSNPMVDLSLFRIESFSYCTAISAAQFLGSTSIFALLAIYLQKGFGCSALLAGAVGLPNAIGSGITAILAGRFALQHGRIAQVLSLVAIIVGVALTVGSAWLVYQGYSPWCMSLPLAIMGLGQGAMGSVNQTQSMVDVPAAQGGTAGGVQQTSQRITTAIGNTILTAIFFAICGTTLSSYTATLALTASFLTALGFIAVALVIAVVFWNNGRKHR